ncbi:MAG: hypothetical protein PUE12_01875 [Oscillospiraceae bacterium]|nr:hypothetical protein [Oscillospiraceae bacterium]
MTGERFINNPEIIVFAGPNGSGKSTITEFANILEPYINADNIKKSNYCTDIEAAVKAEEMRNNLIDQCKSFTFETVLSTDRNIKLLRSAKENGYFIRCIYVLTADLNINIIRVKARKASGGHDVPKEKILSRYKKSLDLIPELLEICDFCHIYDNSFEPFRIFKKRKTEYYYWENDFWNKSNISELTNIEL